MDKITIETRFKIGQTVYLKTDSDNRVRMVAGIIIKPKDILYELVCGESFTCHFDFEISEEKHAIV